MSDIQKEIKEALEKATPGPWRVEENWRDEPIMILAYEVEKVLQPICELSFVNCENDAHLIANAPTWLLYQQELIEQLQEREFNHYPIVIHDLESRIFAQQELIEQLRQDNEKLSNLLHEANLNGWQKSTESIQEDTERLKLFSDALRQKDAEIERLTEQRNRTLAEWGKTLDDAETLAAQLEKEESL